MNAQLTRRALPHGGAYRHLVRNHELVKNRVPRMFSNIFNYTLIASTIRCSTPLILAALGGLYSERGGVINIALEGMMLAGAFTAAVVTVFTHSPWIGLLAAVIAGLLVAALHAVVTITCRADQVVSGTAINILFLGVPALLSGAL